MNIGVALDSDGHFMVSKITNRRGIIELLKKISDGDTWADLHEDYLEDAGCENESALLNVDEDVWLEFVGNFIERGRFELVYL